MSFKALKWRLSVVRAGTWFGFALAGAVIHVMLWLVSEPEELFSDFFKANYPVGERLLSQGPVATWVLDEPSAVGFVNIPILAWVTAPLVPLGEEAAGFTFLVLGAAATLGAWALLVRVGGLKSEGAAALLFLFLANGPLVNSLREGNTTHFMLLLLVVALFLWRRGSEYAAGLVLGVCAVFKLPLMLYGVYFVLRRRWRVVAGGATSIGLAVLLSLLVFGLEINIGWYRCCVEPFMGGVMPAFNVQSIDGFLMRLATGEEQLRVWEPREPAAVHKIVRLFVLAALYGGAYWLMRRADRKKPAARRTTALGGRDYLEFALVLNLAIVTSPVSWTHYYLLLLLPLGLYLGGRLALPDDATTRWLMWSGFMLSSLPLVLVPLDPSWFTALAARTLVSAWLFGGLLMLAALARGAWHGAGVSARRLWVT